MAKNTSTAKGFEAGETNARAVRSTAPAAGAPAIAQTPQRDAKAAAVNTTADAPATPVKTPPEADAVKPPKGESAKKAKK